MIETYKEYEVYKIWNDLVERELFTVAELRLITDMNGYSIETLNQAIKARYGRENYEKLLFVLSVHENKGLY